MEHSNDDDEWIEEESIVLLELSGIIDLDYLSKCGESCKILGIETEEPVLQLGNLIFAGKYQDTMGTAVILEEDKEQPRDGENIQQWKYKCHTFKKLDMTRAFITPKQQTSELEEEKGGESQGLKTKSTGPT